MGLIKSKEKLLLKVPHLEVASGDIASFSTDMIAGLKELKIHFYPLQSGTGTPSPENQRPLSGWSGLDIWGAGRNLFDKDSMVDRSQTCYIDESGNIVSNRNWYITDWIPVEGTTVTISGVGGNAPAIALYDKNKNFLVGHRYGTSTADIKTSITLTASQDAYYCRFSVYYREDYADSIKLELGSSATDYEPFIGTKNSVLFPTTYYGGYVDVLTGEGVATYKYLHVTGTEPDSSWYAASSTVSGVGCRATLLHADDAEPSGTYKAIISDKLASYIGWQPPLYHGNINNGGNFMFATPEGVNTVSTIKEYIQGMGGIDVAWEATTPVEFTVDPLTLKTLRGQNNIWSNANGEVDVKFWTH